MAATETKGALGMKSYAAIYVGLLCIVAIEVFVTYRHLSTQQLIIYLLIFAFTEAGIAVMYFMHLKDERPSLVWSLILALLFVLFMMDHFWPDALRLGHLRIINW
jgi:cytochrome c oxidase subunit IV